MGRNAIGGHVNEDKTLSPNLTDLNAFARQALDEGQALVERWHDSASSLGGVLQGLSQAGYEPVPLLYATAMPSGLVTRDAYQTLLRRFLDRLQAALPID